MRPAILVFSLCLAAPLAAHAQGPVDEGVAAYESGEFEAARAAFARAEEGEGLSRADLVRLLATRALLSFAEGRSEAMQRDLSALATLAPEYDLGERAPPAVREAFEAARATGGELGLEVSGARVAGGAQVRAEATHDRAGLVRRLALAARADGEWVRSEAGEVTLPGDADTLEYAAARIGPGGATLVSEGTEAVPQRIVLPPLETDSGGDDGLAIGLGVAGGVLLAAAAVVLVVVLVGQDDQSSAVAPPRIEWP